MKKITVIIDKEGRVTAETTGYSGDSCKDATKLLDKVLGGPATDTTTPEMYTTVEQQQEERA